MLLVITGCWAQVNKFEAGDFGIRYGVIFNGSAYQGLTLSGMVTANIEVGCGINIAYSKSQTSSTNNTEVQEFVNGSYIEVLGASTNQNHSSTINTSLTPFVFYHFSIKNNLDIYTGPGLIVGTGSHTLLSSNDNTTQATNYYYDNYSKTKYPIGYQVGGGWNIGGQYFFYKRLALGVQASVGVAYSSTDGYVQTFYRVTNSGSGNQNNPNNVSSAGTAPYINRGLSLTTASSIGVNLTFYLARKAKAAKQAKTL
jgi:hypothetical protein